MKIDVFSPKFASALTSAAMLATTGVLPFITYIIWQMIALPEPEALAVANEWTGSGGGRLLFMLGLPTALMLVAQNLEMHGAIRRRRLAREKYLAARAAGIPWKPFG